MPDLTGAVLLIEDVSEELYAVDRALTQLRLSGVLGRVAAVLIGSFNGWKDARDVQLYEQLPGLVCAMVPAHVTVASGVAGKYIFYMNIFTFGLPLFALSPFLYEYMKSSK